MSSISNISQSSSSGSSLEYYESKLSLRGNVVMRQELESFTPRCSTKCGVIVFVILLILFLAFGLPILIISSQIKQITLDFTDCLTSLCTQDFTLDAPIAPPIFLYYSIENFYNNHRYYQKSQIIDQLRGKIHVDSSDNKNCQGAKYIYEMFDNDTTRYYSHTGVVLKGEDYANPCGLIAKSMYNDTKFQIINTSSRKEYKINETNIVNNYDKKYAYKEIGNSSEVQWISASNEHFIVWMQMETFPIFKKLWGRVDKEMDIGNYTLQFENNWNVSKFKGKKKIILSNSSKIGTGMFFGYVLCGAAGYCIIMLVIISICQCCVGKRVYIVKNLKWD